MTAAEICYWHGQGADFFAGTPGANAPRSAVATHNVAQITRYVRALAQ